LEQGAKEKSGVAEHSTQSSHRVKFHDPEMLAKTLGNMDRHVKESKEMKFHPDNMNIEEGLKLSKAWSPITSLLRCSNTHTHHDNHKMTQRGACKNKIKLFHTRLSNTVKG
jgi:hypothetical protein